MKERPPVDIRYNDGHWDRENYPLQPWHRKAIQVLADALGVPEGTVWYYQATIQGRVFWFTAPRRGRYMRAYYEQLQFLFNLPGFRWIEPRENGHGLTVGLAHTYLETPEPRLQISDNADSECRKLLEALRRGDWPTAEKCLAELERVYHYAVSAPSWRGFCNLTHCFRMLLTSHLLGARTPFENLTAIEDAARYDPGKFVLPTSTETAMSGEQPAPLEHDLTGQWFLSYGFTEVAGGHGFRRGTLYVDSDDAQWVWRNDGVPTDVQPQTQEAAMSLIDSLGC